MKEKYLYKIIMIWCLIVTQHGFTQETSDTNLMPTPEIWSFMKYGNIKPQLYSGTVAVSIPIYTYKDPDFEIPIALNYASNGYTPNNQAPSTGLGWYLAAGGYITREVVGVRDESHMPTTYGFYEYYLSGSTPPDDNTIFDKGGIDLQSYPRIFYFHDSKKFSYIETTPDIFSFNFLGHNGKFSLGCQKIYVYDTERPHGEYQIDVSKISTRIENTIDWQTGSEIRITTGDGYLYTFTRVGWMAHIEKYTRRGSEYVYKYMDSPRNYWALTKIQAPNKRTVEFIYGNEEFSDKSQYYSKIYNSENPGVTTTREHVYQLKEIKIDNVSINFSYAQRQKEKVYYIPRSSDHQYTPETLASTNRLSSVVVNEHNNEIRRCEFEYRYAPEKDNPVMFLSSVDIKGEGKYTMDYYDIDSPFPAHATTQIDHWGYYNNNGKEEINYSWANLFPTVTVDDKNIETITSHNRDPHFLAARKGMLKKMAYPTYGYTCFYYEPHTYTAYVTRDLTRSDDWQYHNNLPYLAKCIEREAGGVRIRKITDYTTPMDSTYREYSYASLKNGTVQGSGIMLFLPRYSAYGTTRPVNLAAYTMDRTHIEYSVVNEYFPDKSFKRYYFSNYETLPDIKPDFSFWSPHGISTSLTNEKFMQIECTSRATQRGKLLLEENYNRAGLKLQSRECTYDYNKNLRKHIAILGETNYYRHKMIVEDYPLTTIKYHTFGEQLQATDMKKFRYNVRGQISSVTNYDSEGCMICDSIVYVADQPEQERHTAENSLLSKNMFQAIRQKIKIANIEGSNRIIQALQYNYDIKDDLPFLHSIFKALEKPKMPNEDLEYYCPYLEYNEHDTLGRVVQKIDGNFVTTNYIWGYGGLYPVAKIGSAKLDEIRCIRGLENIDHQPLPGGLSELQNKLLREIKAASVITYDYKPLVGVIEVRDESGYRTSYKYNSTGKLIEVIDDDGNPIKKYEYSTDEL